MGRPVVVAGLDGDEGKHILLVVCLDPPEAYASKNQKHLGFLVEGRLVPDKDVVVSQNESNIIAAAYTIMQDALTSLQGRSPQSGAA